MMSSFLETISLPLQNLSKIEDKYEVVNDTLKPVHRSKTCTKE